MHTTNYVETLLAEEWMQIEISERNVRNESYSWDSMRGTYNLETLLAEGTR